MGGGSDWTSAEESPLRANEGIIRRQQRPQAAQPWSWSASNDAQVWGVGHQTIDRGQNVEGRVMGLVLEKREWV